jgi:enoyl-CoA hydratase/carnithine racemase
LVGGLTAIRGGGLEAVDLTGDGEGISTGRISVGILRDRASVGGDHAAFDILLCEDAAPPPPWVGTRDMDGTIARLRDAVTENPLAATTFAHLLRHSSGIGFDAALNMESLAYSTLLASKEFVRWRAATPRRERQVSLKPRVKLEIEGILHIVLSRPEAHNAFDSRMRDELVEAFEFALAESNDRQIAIRGEGASFCAGGDLDEFGTAEDVAMAHCIRMQQSPVSLLHRLSTRATAFVHGACIGAGIELPAAASKIVATRDSWFKLPEISMGLIPGAGGTVTITRRIGRHRTCFFALSGEKVDAKTALDWGLIDEMT